MDDEDEDDVTVSVSDNDMPDSPKQYEDTEEIRYIGPLTENQRLSKVRNYIRKKHNKAFTKKYYYVARQQVAEKRLRIKGRFVTIEQA